MHTYIHAYIRRHLYHRNDVVIMYKFPLIRDVLEPENIELIRTELFRLNLIRFFNIYIYLKSDNFRILKSSMELFCLTHDFRNVVVCFIK